MRDIALSGATVALESSPAAVVGNHAMLVNQNGPLQGSFDYGQPQDTSLTLKSTQGDEHRYLIFGASLMPGDRVALGFGTQQVRYLSAGVKDRAKIESFSDALVDLNFSTAVKVSNRIAVSGALIRAVEHRDINEWYKATTTDSTTASTDEAGNAVKLGVLMRLSERVRFGATYRTETNLKGNNKGTVFNGTYIPQIVEYGLNALVFESPGPKGSGPVKLRCNAQLDVMSFSEKQNELYFSSGIAYGEEPNTRLSVVTKYIPRFSLELEAIKRGPLALTAMGGTYVEPPYFMGSLSRSHVTGGASLVIWLVSMNVAVDFAQNYFNRIFGIGLANVAF